MVKITVKPENTEAVLELLEDYTKDENGFIVSKESDDTGALAEIYLEDAQIPFLMEYTFEGETGSSVFMVDEGSFNDDEEDFNRVKELFLEYIK